MRQSDILIEFEEPERVPKEFKFIIFSIPVIVGFYFFMMLDNLQREYIYDKEFLS